MLIVVKLTIVSFELGKIEAVDERQLTDTCIYMSEILSKT